jgi:hypothetical protein
MRVPGRLIAPVGVDLGSVAAAAGQAQCVQARAIAAIWCSADSQAAPIGVPWAGGPMTAPVTASETDLRILAGIISDHRTDLSAAGLPPSLLADLMGQIRCDELTFAGFDSARDPGG